MFFASYLDNFVDKTATVRAVIPECVGCGALSGSTFHPPSALVLVFVSSVAFLSSTSHSFIYRFYCI